MEDKDVIERLQRIQLLWIELGRVVLSLPHLQGAKDSTRVRRVGRAAS